MSSRPVGNFRLGSIGHATDEVAQMLQIQLDTLLLCFYLRWRLPSGPQGGDGVYEGLPQFRRPDWLLLGKSHLTLDIFGLVGLQPFHCTLLWSSFRCRGLTK